MVEAFPLIEVSGGPRQRGRQYGRQAAARIRRGAAHYTAQLQAMRLGESDLRDLVARFLPRIDQFDPNYTEEMRGIAEGAEVGLETIALLNARTEILKLGQRESQARKDAAEDGCTGAVILPEAAADGVLVHGQNWDWKAECAETAVVLKARPDSGPAYLTFTEAGALARSGFNERGIGLTANYLECERDYRELGVPLVFIRRKVLESEHFALAMRAVYCTPKSAANNMMLSMADGFAIDFECAPDETFPVNAERGLIVHANHWQSTVALTKLRETGISSVPESLYRDVRVRQLLEARRGRLGKEALRQALFDDFGTPWSVCRPPRKNFQNNLSATVAMVLMEPGRGVMEVAPLPALNRNFTTYRLDPAAAARAAE